MTLRTASGSVDRYEIAKTIARWLYAFEPMLPRPRKIWKSDDRRMSMFDAASLALTHFYFKNQKSAVPERVT